MTAESGAEQPPPERRTLPALSREERAFAPSWRSALPGTLPVFSREEWAALLLLLVALVASITTILRGSENHHSHLIDSYYYLGAADGILDSGLPRLAWPQGPENKFFPGYPYALALASAVTFRTPLEAWRPLGAALFLAIPLLAFPLFRQWGCCRRDAMLAAALLVGNATVVRWGSIPYSEHWCLLMLLAEAVVLGGRGGSPWRRVLLAGFFGGWAVATRVEAALLQPLLFAVDWRTVRTLWDWRRFALWTAMVLAPISLWVWWSAGGPTGLHYLGEGRESFTWMKYYHAFLTMSANAVRDNGPYAPNFLVHVGMKGIAIAFLVSLALALRGLCGAAARAAAAALLGYWLLHAAWYYSTERYNLVVAPLTAFVLARGVGWFADRGSADPPRAAPVWRWTLFSLIVLLQTQWGFLIELRNSIVREDLSDGESQLVASELKNTPGAILTNRAANFAYWQDRSVWIGWDIPMFNRGLLRDAPMESVIKEKAIRIVVLDRPARELMPEATWLADLEQRGLVKPRPAGRLLIYVLPDGLP